MIVGGIEHYESDGRYVVKFNYGEVYTKDFKTYYNEGTKLTFDAVKRLKEFEKRGKIVVITSLGVVPINGNSASVKRFRRIGSSAVEFNYGEFDVFVMPPAVIVNDLFVDPKHFDDVLKKITPLSALVKRVSPPPKPLPEWKDWKDALKKLKKSIPGYCVRGSDRNVVVETARGVVSYNRESIDEYESFDAMVEYVLGFRDDFEGTYYVNLDAGGVEEIQYNFGQYVGGGFTACKCGGGSYCGMSDGGRVKVVIGSFLKFTGDELYLPYIFAFIGRVDSLGDVGVENLLPGARGDKEFIIYDGEYRVIEEGRVIKFFTLYDRFVLTRDAVVANIPYFDGVYRVFLPWDAPVDPWDKKYSWEVPYKKEPLIKVPFWESVQSVGCKGEYFVVSGDDFYMVMTGSDGDVEIIYRNKKYVIDSMIINSLDKMSVDDFISIVESFW